MEVLLLLLLLLLEIECCGGFVVNRNPRGKQNYKDDDNREGKINMISEREMEMII